MERFYLRNRIPSTKRNLKTLIPWFLLLIACSQLKRYFMLTKDMTFSNHRAICIESPTGNLTRRVARYQGHPLSWETIGKFQGNHSKVAACEFKISKHSDHFPHAMQQLYQCWSYWNLPKNKFNEKILLLPKNAKGFPKSALSVAKVYNKIRGKDWGFVAGITTAWQDAANVTVTSNSFTMGPTVRRQDRANAFFMESPEDARLLTKTIADHYGLPTRAGCTLFPALAF
jgi:hypothetical protein